MDRLTKPGYKFNLVNVLQGLSRYADVDEILNRLSAYEDTGLEPEEINHIVDVTKMISVDRLRELAEADKDGRAVVLPCKVGEIFYTVEQKWTQCRFGDVFDEYDCRDCEEKCDSKRTLVVLSHIAGTVSQLADYIGKPVFTSQKEAEQALKEREN